MTLRFYTTTITSSVGIVNLSNTDDVVVSANANLLSGTYAIYGSDSGRNVTVMGSIFGVLAAIDLFGNGSGDWVTIAAGATVTGGDAIFVASDDATINNAGSLAATDTGIYLVANGPIHSQIMNSGSILATIGIFLAGSGPIDVLNTGRIDASDAALRGNSATEAHVENFGTMIGDLSFGDLSDTLLNRGSIDGSIAMGEGDDHVTIKGHFDGFLSLDLGNDTYNGVRSLVTDDISMDGGDGNDSFFMGAASETVQGGVGIDTVNYSRSQVGVSVFLDGSGVNGGAAQGDVLSGVERVAGTNYNDSLLGSDADNYLSGSAGVDTISGGLGADTLSGDAGVDRLTGGLGNDHFTFFGSAGESFDTILDFHNVAGDDDVFDIYTGGSFAGLAAGALAAAQFQARVDNVAQDADDRFIFRTTDTTLWYDSNGSGVGGLREIAHLQASAVLTFADFFIH